MNYRGMSLVEVLVASVIGGVIMLGSAKSLMFSLQAGGVAKVGLVEDDFKFTLNRVLSDEASCKASLAPSELTGDVTNKNKGIGRVTSLSLVLESGQDPEKVIKNGDFKNNIEVVKMELMGDSSKDATSSVIRNFVAYYKKKNLGDLNTVAGGECVWDETDTAKQDVSGCYFKKCRVEYKVKDDPDDATKKVADTCKALDCNALQVIQAGVNSRIKCDWGEVYTKGGDPECDPRDKKVSADYIDTSKMKIESGDGDIGSCLKNKVWKADKKKCVCEGDFVLAVDGRCLPQQDYSWPPKCFISTYTNAQNKMIDYFCSNKYMGERYCYILDYQNTLTGSSLPTRVIYKRIYNRETGQVKCQFFTQKKHKNCVVKTVTTGHNQAINQYIKTSGVTCQNPEVGPFHGSNINRVHNELKTIYSVDTSISDDSQYTPKLPRTYFDNATK